MAKKLLIKFSKIKSERRLVGELLLSDLSRVRSELPEQNSKLNYEIYLRHDPDELKYVIAGEIIQICNRCLSEFKRNIELNNTIKIIAESDELQEKEFDIVVLNTSGELNLFEILEDELLLEVTSASRHRQISDCALKLDYLE